MKRPRTARAEIERLRTELEESVRLHFAAHQRMERAEAERDDFIAELHQRAPRIDESGDLLPPIDLLRAVLAERDALRADAERYRWLRDGPACIVDMVSDPDNLVQLWYVAAPGLEKTAVGATLDAAIDAAMQRKEQSNG